jgi:hypothetical protein
MEGQWGDLSEEITYTEDPPLLQAKNSLKSLILRSNISVESAETAVRLYQQQRGVLDGKIDQLVELQKQLRFEKKDLEDRKKQLSFQEAQLKEARSALSRERDAWQGQKRSEKHPKSAKLTESVPPDQLKQLKEDFKERENRAKMTLEKAQRDIASLTKENTDLAKQVEDLQRDLNRLKAPKPRKSTKAEEIQTEKERVAVDLMGEVSFLHHDEVTGTLVETRESADGRVQKKYSDGRVESEYPNGTHRVVYSNGYSCVTLPNKDVRQIFPDGHSVYFYSETKTVHWVYPDGSQVIRFANGQVEKHRADGSSKIKYVDGTMKTRTTEGEETCEYADGVVQRTDPRGNKVVVFPGGHEVEVLKEAKALE